MLPESWNTTHHAACSFVFLGVPYKIVCSNSSESSDRKKKLLCCSVPGKASFPLDLCLHPCTWSFLHATCSFFLVFPSVWRFLHKALAAAVARGVVCCGCPSPVPVPPQGLCMLCWEPWHTNSHGARPGFSLIHISTLRSFPLPSFFLKLLLGWVIFESLVPDKLCLQGTIASKVKGTKQVDRVWLHRAFFPWGTAKNQVGKLAGVQILSGMLWCGWQKVTINCSWIFNFVSKCDVLW